MLRKVYSILLKNYGPQGWWPLSKSGLKPLHYMGRPSSTKDKFEIIVGAILTQNTSWSNVEKAIFNLNSAHLLDVYKIAKVREQRLARLIKPSGYYNMKAKKLKHVALFLLSNPFKKLSSNTNLRQVLLSLYGIGEETADSILLYAFEKPFFVIDAYTKRIFSRLIGVTYPSYSSWQEFFMLKLKKDVTLYKEYHALIVAHAKKSCKKNPSCSDCCLKKICKKNI